MRVVFMGTPDFSVKSLEYIVNAGHEVALVVTQPDKKRGRRNELQPTPVKEAALLMGLEVYTPEKIRDAESVEKLKSCDADVFVVVAFGQILSREVLDIPRYCCVNVHASLLPKLRGAAPIQWAVIDGEEVSGVTTMRMDEGLDTGDMIMREEIRLAPDETGGSLFDKLSVCGAGLIVKTLDAIEDGSAVYTPQDDSQATMTRIIKKELGKIDFTKSALEIERLIRGLNPWPSAYTSLDGRMLKIWGARVLPEKCDAEPGIVISADEFLNIATGDGVLEVRELQLEGKKRMSSQDFLRGMQTKPVNKRLG